MRSAKTLHPRTSTSSCSKREKRRRHPCNRRNTRPISLRRLSSSRADAQGLTRLRRGGPTGAYPSATAKGRVWAPADARALSTAGARGTGRTAAAGQEEEAPARPGRRPAAAQSGHAAHRTGHARSPYLPDGGRSRRASVYAGHAAHHHPAPRPPTDRNVPGAGNRLNSTIPRRAKELLAPYRGHFGLARSASRFPADRRVKLLLPGGLPDVSGVILSPGMTPSGA